MADQIDAPVAPVEPVVDAPVAPVKRIEPIVEAPVDATAEAKAASEKFNADRIKRGQDENRANAERLYLGMREIIVMRKAAPDDVGYFDDRACSVVIFVGVGVEFVVQDADIKTAPTF